MKKLEAVEALKIEKTEKEVSDGNPITSLVLDVH